MKIKIISCIHPYSASERGHFALAHEFRNAPKATNGLGTIYGLSDIINPYIINIMLDDIEQSVINRL